MPALTLAAMAQAGKISDCTRDSSRTTKRNEGPVDLRPVHVMGKGALGTSTTKVSSAMVSALDYIASNPQCEAVFAPGGRPPLFFPGQTLVPEKATFQCSPGIAPTAWQVSCPHCSRPVETVGEREVVVSSQPDPKKDLCVLALTPTALWEGHHGQTVPTDALHSQNSCSYRGSTG